MSTSALLLPRPPISSSAQTTTTSLDSPLPPILHTPAGLALLEMQGTINLPHRHDQNIPDQTSIGRLVFPGYDPDERLNTWTKTVHMYVGQHQRLTGEVKKLAKAIAIIRKKIDSTKTEVDEKPETLEIVEIIKFKILFSQRPEPVGTWNGED